MRWLALPFVVLIAGCAADAELPAPGAQGPILIHQWDTSGRAVVLKARTLRQVDTLVHGWDQEVDLDEVMARAPLEQGVFVAQAPSARYSPRSRPSAVLPAPGSGPDAVVRVAGVLRGVPLIGRATRAQYDEKAQTLHLADLEVCYLGNWTWYHEAVIHPNRPAVTSGGQTAHRAPLGVVSALAALPEAMEIPPLTTR
jgi:hypothetical protein